MNITIYSTTTCGFCHMLKQYLSDNNIAFNEKRVDVDQEAAREMVSISHQMGVPFTVIKKDDGTEEAILGFDLPRFRKALGTV